MGRTREQVYDEEISPLMTRIIALCKEHDIPLVAQFQIDDTREESERGDAEPFFCTTILPMPNQHERLKRLGEIARPTRAPFVAFTIISQD